MIKIKIVVGQVVLSTEQAEELVALRNEGVVSITGGYEHIRIAFYNPEDEIAFRLKYEYQIYNVEE